MFVTLYFNTYFPREEALGLPSFSGTWYIGDCKLAINIGNAP